MYLQSLKLSIVPSTQVMDFYRIASRKQSLRNMISKRRKVGYRNLLSYRGGENVERRQEEIRTKKGVLKMLGK